MSLKTIPYARQWLDEEDIAAVVAVLRSDWLTTGPQVPRFEQKFAEYVGAAEAVAVSSGTAALHAAVAAAGIGPGDEALVPAITFAATANALVYQGARPVFVDVDPQTLLIDPSRAADLITPRTKAILAVDFAGQPADYAALRSLADRHGLTLIADACHALGGDDQGRRVGTLADLSAFSLQAVKPITTGEGGMITTNNPELARRMRTFRNHGIDQDHRQRDALDSWYYEMVDLGYNYRLTDFQCALGLSQLRKAPEWLSRRRQIAARYDAAFAGLRGVQPLAMRSGVGHAYHLYVVQLDLARLDVGREAIFRELRGRGLRVAVHYIPVYWHPFHRRRFGFQRGLCPSAEAAYERILTMPLFAELSDCDCQRVLDTVREVVERHQR